MKRITVLFAVCALVLFVAPCTFAADDCGPQAVKANVDKAAQIVKEKGKAGFEEAGKIRFCKDEGYIYITDINGLMLMHPVSQHLVGKSVAAIKDPTGKLFYAEIIEKVKGAGVAWVPYKWPKPGDKNPADKCGFARKVTADGQDYIVASGLYDVPADKCKE
jgi:signal transduction histidine kinase